MRFNPLLVEIAGSCGYDFLILDREQGRFSEDEFARSLEALRTTDVLSMVRLAGHEPDALRRYLDLGAHGIVVPHVSAAEQAHILADAMEPYREASLVVILESALGAEHAEEILRVSKVAGALVGPGDLSADLRCAGDYAHPAYLEAVAGIEHAAAISGKALGTIPHGNHTLDALVARGYCWFVLDTDESLMRDALSAKVRGARALLDLAEQSSRLKGGSSA